MNTMFKYEHEKLKEEEKFDKATPLEKCKLICTDDLKCLKYNSAQEYYNKAQEFINSGIKRKSKYCLTKACELQPDNIEYLKELIKIEENDVNVLSDSHISDHEYIIKLYDRLFALEHDNPEIHYQKALLCKNFFENDSAIIETIKAIEINNKNSKYYLFLALLYEHNNNYSDAINAYTKAIELDSMNVEYYFKRAKLYYQIKDYKNAYFDVNRYIVFSSNLSEAYYLKYKICLECKEYKLALDNISMAINEGCNNAENYYMYGQKAELLHIMKKYKDEFDCLIKAKKYTKNIPNYYKRLIIALLKFFVG